MVNLNFILLFLNINKREKRDGEATKDTLQNVEEKIYLYL